MKKPIKTCTFLLAFLIITYPQKEYAQITTFGDLLDELARVEQKKEEQERQVALSQAEYEKVSNEIITSQQKIQEYNEEIVAATKKIAELEEEIQKKQDETARILVFLEISSGEKSYLEYIFNATSFTDFIHRVSIVEEISKYNKDLIKEMNELIEENERQKKKLAESIKKEEEEKARLEESQRKIGARINELYSEGASIDEEIDGVKEKIAFYEEKGCSERDDILSQCSAIPPATGFLRPINTGIVTSDYGFRISPIYGTYEGHTGVDIGNSYGVGTPIYPVAAGTVAFEVNWACGGRVIGIHHNVRGVAYTSMYMHLQSFNVNVGDTVYEDDIIGYMGGIYDNCSTGAHVHLSMTYGHLENAGNYKSYIFDPNTVVYFPSGWFTGRSW